MIEYCTRVRRDDSGNQSPFGQDQYPVSVNPLNDAIQKELKEGERIQTISTGRLSQTGSASYMVYDAIIAKDEPSESPQIGSGFDPKAGAGYYGKSAP